MHSFFILCKKQNQKNKKQILLHYYFYSPPHTFLWFLLPSSQHTMITVFYSSILNGHFPNILT